MTEELAILLRQARKQRGWSLREVERRTGVHNAHLSQIEQGRIEKPAMHLLFKLSRLYDLDYARLMRLAGHASDNASAEARTLQGAALHSMSDLSEAQLKRTLEFLEELRNEQRRGDP